jgi:very-short-patch-repair endonuclease
MSEMSDRPENRDIVFGRHAPEKRELAWQMRRTMTPAESILWQCLRRSQLQGLHFRRQQVIDGFIADFYCHSARLVVEVDGPVHEGATEHDAERDAILTARGLRVLRITNERVLTDLDSVLAEIAAAADRSDLTPLTHLRWVPALPLTPVRVGKGELSGTR